MGIPDHRLSTTPILGYLLYPDDQDPSPILDYELGGVALNNPSEGLMVKVWHAQLVVDGVKEISQILIGADGVPNTVFLTGSGLTEVSLSFDQNMNPAVAYVQDGISKFYWYDTAIPGYITTELPAGSRSPKCCLDDKRSMETSSSDILLFYMRGVTLYYREQRDRFLVEYTLATGLGGQDVLAAGMSNVNRVQIGIGLQDYPPGIVNYRKTVDGRQRITTSGARRRLVKVSYG